MMKYLHFILSILLLLCLLPMPYGYLYACSLRVDGGFGVMACRYYEQNNMVLAIVFGFLALLFQPFIKIPWAHPMERGGCDCGNFIVSFAGVTTSKSESGTSVGRCRGLRLADIEDIDVEV